MNWYLKVLKQYANFGGRARRKEYWMFTLFNTILLIIAMILDNLLGTTAGELKYGMFYFLYALAVFIPGLAVSVRRLHDIGKSGWNLFFSLIPIVGGLYLFVLMLTDSIYDENIYGPCPKDISAVSQGQGMQSGNTIKNNYANLIQNEISTESIKGIIPIHSARLRLLFADISFTLSLREKFLMGLLCFCILIIPTFLIIFMIGDLLAFQSGVKFAIGAIIFLYGIIVYFVVKGIVYYYITHMKTYPTKVFFVISDKDLHCILIENNKIKKHYNFNIKPTNLEKYFYGEIDKNTKRIKEKFELRVEGITQVSGRLSLKNGQLYSEELPAELILPMKELQKIYLG